ncbi:MAG: hypothetical protein LC650_05460 [Actinobacteria bacterium]|nr:hypothetical protein [Actinomycetota bacterium]
MKSGTRDASKISSKISTLIREFIIRCLHDYKPRPGWPGMSFMFMWGQRKNILQELELEAKQEQRDSEREDVNYGDVEEWL